MSSNQLSQKFMIAAVVGTALLCSIAGYASFQSIFKIEESKSTENDSKSCKSDSNYQVDPMTSETVKTSVELKKDDIVAEEIVQMEKINPTESSQINEPVELSSSVKEQTPVDIPETQIPEAELDDVKKSDEDTVIVTKPDEEEPKSNNEVQNITSNNDASKVPAQPKEVQAIEQTTESGTQQVETPTVNTVDSFPENSIVTSSTSEKSSDDNSTSKNGKLPPKHSKKWYKLSKKKSSTK